MTSEREIHQWLEEAITNGDVLEKIEGLDQVDTITELIESINQSPTFTVDYVLRRQSALAAKSVIGSLSCTEVISSDRSISATAGETLRPDLVLYNCEEKSIIIIEIKKEKQTAREAITELLAYEHEVKNHFPFMSNHDIKLVIASQEWSHLLDHSVASLVAWEEKKLLALEISGDVGSFGLKVRLPPAWKSLSSIGLPKNSLPVITINLYPKEFAKETDWVDLERHLSTAVELIARDADRANAHGFAMLWEDHSHVSACKYNITIAAVNPYAFFEASLEKEAFERDYELLRFFCDNAPDYLGLQHPSGMMTIAERAISFLSNWCSPMWEGFFEWEHVKAELPLRADPIRFEFWGALGDYAREYTTSPAVYSYLMPLIGKEGLDWRDPIIALPVLDELTGYRPIPEGALTAQACYDLGVIFGVWIQIDELRLHMQSIKAAPIFECLLKWSNARLFAAYSELGSISQSYSDLEEPPPPFVISFGPRSDDVRNAVDAVISWMKQHVIGPSNTFHTAAFDLGILSAPQEFPAMMNLYGTRNIGADGALVANYLLLGGIATCVNTMRERPLSERENKAWNIIKETYGDNVKERILRREKIIKETETVHHFRYPLMEFIDSQVPPVFHSLRSLQIKNIDWNWFKEGIKEMHSKGETHPCIILAPDGSIGTGHPRQEMRIMPPIDDPEKEVYFWNKMLGIDSFSRMEWEKLMSGDGLPFSSKPAAKKED